MPRATLGAGQKKVENPKKSILVGHMSDVRYGSEPVSACQTVVGVVETVSAKF